MAIPGIVGYNAHSRGIATASGLMFRQGISSSESDNMGSIRGVNDSAFLTDFSDHRLSLIDGRHITPEDKNVMMISEVLARESNLTIGDIAELQPVEMGIDEEGRVKSIVDDNAPSIKATIIGIYAIEEFQLDATRPAAGIASNQMFADHTLVTSLGLAYQGQYYAATFHVNDPNELPRIVSEIRQIEDLNWDYFFMQHNDGDYMRISSDLQTVQNLLMTLLIAIGLVSTIILTLILILRMRGRIHEVGILLSVGIGKKQIWGGFLLEIFILAMLSFISSYISTSLVVPTLSQSLLADLPALAEFGQQQFQRMSPAMYSLVYMLILLIILGTAYFSTKMTIRLKPKQILSKMS